jgi:predicted nuclease of restriction endonuclease-like (RecB) superfamily
MASLSHHLVVLNKCNPMEERLFYLQEVATQYWPVAVLEHQIDSRLFFDKGQLPNNFNKTLSNQLQPEALKIFKDEYLINYIAFEDGDDERTIEAKVVTDIRNFVLRMGKGFSFIGNQFRLEVDGDEFFIDLLFFSRILQSLVAFELKKSKFKPEFAGQLNFYLTH